MKPAYLTALENGKLKSAAENAGRMLSACRICPRQCGVDRLNSKTGFCRTGSQARVYSYLPHFGEEPPVSGSRGSGTIFFSGCSLGCVYCQNHTFSQAEQGREMGSSELAAIMIELQDKGCHNINLVTPTHVMPQILKAVELAAALGLNIPLVYNTSGYELPGAIDLLDGIIDVYLADMRYSEPEAAVEFSGAFDYPGYNRESVKKMHLQVGLPQFDKEGTIRRGLIIRHLVLPNGKSGASRIMRFIAEELSCESYISLMSQYTPYYRASEFPAVSRPLSSEEYESAKVAMAQAGLFNGWTQDSGGLESLAGIYLKPSFGNGA